MTLRHTADIRAEPEQASETFAVHEKQAFAIRKTIRDADRALRARLPFLQMQYQSFVGFAIWASCIAGMVGIAFLYSHGLRWWIALPLSAVLSSFLHELEHDTIHRLYFPNRCVWMQDVMLAGIWVSKLSLNPWTRRDLHLLHHRRSGQIDDVEERLLGLGVKNVFFRVAIAFFPGLAFFLIADIQKSAGTWRLLSGGACSTSRWLKRCDLIFILSPFIVGPLAYYGHVWARNMMVCWVLPNVWRHACIVLMSSYSHYYGIPAGDLMFQNQILRHWSLLPLQLFCVNFGAEHIIHHFVVDQPFYVRHLVRHEAWAVLEANGVRVNDFGIVSRANRWSEDAIGPLPSNIGEKVA